MNENANRAIIHVDSPYIIESDGKARMCVNIRKDNEQVYLAWYEVDAEYKSYLCTERSDGIVVNLLLYAMEHQCDIETTVPMSSALYYQLTEFLIPAISKNISRYKKIKIVSDTDSSILPSENAVGASLSGGVDSFYTLCRNLHRDEDGFSITHVGFYNAGASGANGGNWARERYLGRIEWISGVADELGLKMVCVDTNINEFLSQDHEPTHTFRTLAIPLILQKLFSKYYFASGFEFHNFKFSYDTVATYDLLNVDCLTTPNLRFYSSGAEASRLEKIKAITDFQTTYNKLNVCTAEIHNCCKCDKCIRTMLALYGMKKLELYKETFDVDYFYANKHRFFALACALRRWKKTQVWSEWDEIYQILKKEITVADRIRGYFVRLYRRLRRVVYRIGFIRRLYDNRHSKNKS